MRRDGTEPASLTAPSEFSRWFCPRCQQLIIAAKASQYVSDVEVRHYWACDACGHEYRTTVRWLAPSRGVTIELIHGDREHGEGGREHGELVRT